MSCAHQVKTLSDQLLFTSIFCLLSDVIAVLPLVFSSLNFNLSPKTPMLCTFSQYL